MRDPDKDIKAPPKKKGRICLGIFQFFISNTFMIALILFLHGYAPSLLNALSFLSTLASTSFLLLPRCTRLWLQHSNSNGMIPLKKWSLSKCSSLSSFTQRSTTINTHTPFDPLCGLQVNEKISEPSAM